MNITRVAWHVGTHAMLVHCGLINSRPHLHFLHCCATKQNCLHVSCHRNWQCNIELHAPNLSLLFRSWPAITQQWRDRKRLGKGKRERETCQLRTPEVAAVQLSVLFTFAKPKRSHHSCTCLSFLSLFSSPSSPSMQPSIN